MCQPQSWLIFDVGRRKMIPANTPSESGNPASPEALEALRRAAGIDLPDDYLAFLAISNGGEAPLGIEPGYVVIDSAEDATSQKLQRTFEEFFPGFFVFGGNGGGELFAFDHRGSKPWPVVMIDMTNIDLKESVVRVADDFSQLAQQMGVE